MHTYTTSYAVNALHFSIYLNAFQLHIPFLIALSVWEFSELQVTLKQMKKLCLFKCMQV